MDATYKTTKYAIPLFFVYVHGNTGCMVVAEFMCQNEDRAVARGVLGTRPPPNFYKVAQFGNFFNPIRKVWRQAYFKKIIHLCPCNLIKFKGILQSCSK